MCWYVFDECRQGQHRRSPLLSVIAKMILSVLLDMMMVAMMTSISEGNLVMLALDRR